MSKIPLLSVIIANWNGEQLLRNCLSSIFQKTTDLAFEVIVIDDASTDKSCALVEKEYPRVKLIRSDRNVGFAAANNKGIREAAGAYILLLNNDTILKNNALNILVSYLESHPDVGICGGTLVNSDGSLQHSYGDFPSLTEALQGTILLGEIFPGATWVRRRAIIPPVYRPEPREVEYVVGADLALRREVYDAFGLFDESLTAYCEDTDLCYRVLESGKWKVAYVPAAEIVHLYSMSYSEPQGKIRQQLRSYDYFFRKHHGTVYAIVVRFLYAWQYFLKMLLRTVRFLAGTGDFKAVREAWYWIRYCFTL